MGKGKSELKIKAKNKGEKKILLHTNNRRQAPPQYKRLFLIKNTAKCAKRTQNILLIVIFSM